MAYEGKFKDTFPTICAAGLKSRPNFTVGATMRQYTFEDEIQAIKADLHIPRKECIQVKLPKTTGAYRSPGIFSEGRDLLRPPAKTRFHQVISDLNDTKSESYWNKELGETRDPTPAFPEGTKIDEITFGDPSKNDGTVKELVQPPKTRYQVLSESQVNHDVYKKIYGSYNPGEHIDRGYESPPYNPNELFGVRCGYDKRGLKTKCCLAWYNTDPVSAVNLIQKNWATRTRRNLGRTYEPNQVLEFLPKSHRFGVPYEREMYGVEDLLREPDTPVAFHVRNLRTWLASLNRLKMLMEQKISPTFDYNVLYTKLNDFDKDDTGFISFCLLLEIMRCYEVFFNIKNIKALMTHLEIIVGDQVDYKRFLDAVKGKISLGKNCDLSPDQIHVLSTYQAACCDHFIPDKNVNGPIAGLPTRRFDERKPSNPHSDKYTHLSDYTDVKSCLQPSIFTQYSLSHRDFFVPRNEDTIKTLFRNVGYNISDENFQKLWKIGLESDKSGNVCVQTFRDLLKEHYPLQIKLTVDEVPCY